MLKLANCRKSCQHEFWPSRSEVQVQNLFTMTRGQSSNSWFGAPGAPGHWGSHDPLKINTRRKSEVKFIFQNSASLDPRTGLSPLTSPSSPPTPPPSLNQQQQQQQITVGLILKNLFFFLRILLATPFFHAL